VTKTVVVCRPVRAEICGMNAMAAAITPQLNMIRAIQRRAPNRSSAMLDGTSKKK
jgi:hypothetical protein